MLSWRELNEKISSLSEAELSAMIDSEMRVDRRTSVVVRMHQRYTALRAARERKELLDNLNASGTTPPGERCSP